MAKARPIYTCGNCGGQQPKWQGQCPDCGAWNTLTESAAMPKRIERAPYAGQAAVTRLDRIDVSTVERLTTGLGELDRVLGGGLVPGGVVLIGGEPGIGKSTLLLRALANLASQIPTCYVTGEESLEQSRTPSAAPRRCGGAARYAGRDVRRGRARQRRFARQARRAGHRFDPNAVQRGAAIRSRLRESGARLRCAAHAVREVAQRGDAADRSRHEGGHARRSARPRAHGRYGAVLRKRRRQPVPNRSRPSRTASAPRTRWASSS